MGSLYENLPIYKKALELVVYFEKIVRNFSKYHKYTVGTELRDSSRKILKLVVKANSTRNKREILLKVREEIEELKILIKICKEIQVFRSFKSFEYSLRNVINIAKQNEGWLKSQNQGSKEIGP
ncbi:MAG: four helix bundle protein [Candidatus Omnitrophota bacterium]|nr:four helix bundle protein [Candidatus Omnitrophota bacterium]